jgi:hypothetical protein
MTVTFDASSLSPIGYPWHTLSHSRTWEHAATTEADVFVVVVVVVRRNEPVDPQISVV